MLKRQKESIEQESLFLRTAADSSQGFLENLMKGYSKLTIDDPLIPFREKDLNQIGRASCRERV